VGKINREKFKVLEGVFDEKTLDLLNSLKQKKYFDNLLRPIKTGKEADAYLCENKNEKRVLKIYRVTSANFKKISIYINRDYRFRNIRGNLRKVIFIWVSKEFKNLKMAYKTGLNVPYPYKQLGNIILMEYIDGPMLKDIELENPEEFFEILIEQLSILINNTKLVHGDLSEYNILVKDQIPYIIDFGQSMSIRNEEDFLEFKDLFERDIENVVNYFKKRYKLKVDKNEVIKKILNLN
jgi:RIO kinase 1